MKKPSIQDLVYHRTIPHPKPNDPSSFFAHVQRNLVPEVRIEVQTFYGTLDCIEAQYPGLDYTFAPHRRRLARHPWHRRLFRTFDDLRLTDGEILSLCQWEGTRSAKEKYEAETKRKIRDTTADCVEPATPGSGPRATRYFWAMPDERPVKKTSKTGNTNLEFDIGRPYEHKTSPRVDTLFNQRLQAMMEAGSRDDLASFDDQWEEWLKDRFEGVTEPEQEAVRQSFRDNELGISSATNGRYNPASATVSEASTSQHSDDPLPASAQRFDDLRSMLHDLQSANTQLAADNAALAMLLSRSQPETA